MAILQFAAVLGAATASLHVTSRFQRAPPARDLREEEIDGCEFTFTTMQKPDKDYFRGAACSAQAHVSLAGPTSALVSFVTPEALASEVVFWNVDAPEDRRAATGAARSYTSIIWVEDRAAKESDIPNFKGSFLGRFPLVLADFWTSDRLSERSRSVDVFFRYARARNTHVEATLNHSCAAQVMSGELALAHPRAFSDGDAGPRAAVAAARAYLALAEATGARLREATLHCDKLLYGLGGPFGDAASLADLAARVEAVAGAADLDAAAPSWYRRYRSSDGDIAAFLAAHGDAALLPGGRVRCELTGHELAPQLPELEAHWAGRRYRNAAKRAAEEAGGAVT